MKKTSIAGLVGLLFTTPIFAETTLNADPVLVTASRVHDDIQNIPANVQIITRQDIQEINSTSIPQILNQLGGLTIRGTSLGQFNLGASVDMGSYGEAAASNTLILINGQRINPIDSSGVAWEMIPVEAIERIEITRGGAGVQYGNRAVGGAINIVTNESAQNINRVSASYGSFNTQTLNALVQNKFNDTLLKVSANTNHTNGWRDNSTATAYAANARITQFFGEDSLYLDISGSHNYSQSPGGVVGLVGQGNPKTAKSNNVGSFFEGENYGATLGGFKQLGSNTTLETDIAYKKANLTYEEPLTPGISNTYDRWSVTISPRLKFDLNNWGSLVTGYDFSIANGGDRTLANARLVDNSLYTIYRLPIAEKFDIDTGYRYQVESQIANDKPSNNLPAGRKNTDANAWDVGLNYKFSQTEKLYVKYNQAFRFSNIDDFWGFANPASNNWDRTFRGALLTPQNDRTYQAGGDFLIGTTKITTSLYHTNTSNEIRYDIINGININDPYLIKRVGFYLNTTSSINDKLTLYTNSNLQDVSYATGPNRGQSVPLAPHLTINARVNYKVNDNWSVGSLINYVSSQNYNGYIDYVNAENTNNWDPSYPNNPRSKMPSYAVADAYANYKSGPWDVRFTVKNIANSHYASFGGIAYIPSVGITNNYYYPSDPRSVFASVSYNF